MGNAIDEFITWYCSELRLAFSRTVVLRYRFYLEQRNLAPSTINVRLAAARRLARIGRWHPPGKGRVTPGCACQNWLTADQAGMLIKPSDSGILRDKRDRAILAALLGCGLRRAELVTLKTDDLQTREHLDLKRRI